MNRGTSEDRSLLSWLGSVGLLLLVLGGAGAPAWASAAEAATPVERRGEAYARLMRAWFAVSRDDRRAVAEEIREAIALEPRSPDLRLEAARIMHGIEQPAIAEQLAREALEIDPHHVEALRMLASLAAQDPARHREALEIYEGLLGRGDYDDLLVEELIKLRRQAGDPEGAIELARLLVERRPGDGRAIGLLIQLLHAEDRNREVLEVLLPYLAAHPDDLWLVGIAEDLVRREGAWDLVHRAFADRRDAVGRPTAIDRLYGEALLQLHRVDEATAKLEQALAADPHDRGLAFNLSQAYRAVGRFSDAAELLRGLVAEEPADLWGRYWLGKTLADQGDLDGAIDAYGHALGGLLVSDRPDAPALRDTIRVEMAGLLLAAERVADARRLADALEQPSTAQALELRIRVALLEQDWDRALDMTPRLREAGEDSYSTLLEAEILARAGRWRKSAERLDQAIAKLGPTARMRGAGVYQELGRAARGEELLREWVESHPDDPEAWFQLGFFLHRERRLDEAEAAMRRAIALDPTHAAALNFVGYSLAERRERLDEALELIQRAVEVDRWNGAYLDSLGWVYFRLGRYEEALEPLERAAREHPKDATVLEHLGDLYERLGRPEMAVASWSRALEAGADDPDVLRRKIADGRVEAMDSARSAEEDDAGADRVVPLAPRR